MNAAEPSTPASPPCRALSPAERVRSVLVAAASLTLVAGGHRTYLVDRHTVEPDGRLTLDLPDRTAAPGGVPVVLELTDIAPIAMRNRVRAQVTVHARLMPAGLAARAHPTGAQLTEGARYTFVSGAALAAAT